MSNKKTEFTLSQTEAINYRCSDVLVSAAAGSGKTQVLTERIIGIVSEEKVSVKNILAITFTKLAAAEMKERIKNALSAAYTESKSEFLRGEIDSVDCADITTIDSFCSNLIKKYFYVSGIDPNFKILEENDAEELKNQAIDNVFTQLYEDSNEDFQSLLSVFSANRKDAAFREVVKKIIKFCESEESTDAVLRKSLKTADDVKGRVGKKLLAAAKTKCENALELLEKLKRTDGGQANKRKLEKYEAALRYYLTLNLVSEYDKSKGSAQNNNALCSEVHGMNVVIGELKEVSEKFEEAKPLILNADEDVEFEKTLITKLFALVKKVEDEYNGLKAESAALSFPDLGKLALELLSDETVAEEIKSSYAYIFVDEYQDVNGVQEAIVNKLSRNNCFMVGDLKQSIYGFRGSDPLYFDEKSKTYDKIGKKVINLDKNFRCAKSVVNFVNEVFSHAMTLDDCGIDYAKNPMQYGGLYTDGETEYEGEATLDIYEEYDVPQKSYNGVYSVIEHDKSIKSAERAEYGAEELAVVKLVQDAVTRKYYDIKEPDKSKRYKDITYKDIAVIMGKTKDTGDKVLAALNDSGIPAFFDSKESLFTYPEVKAIVSLAEFLNLSASDVPLASAMLNFGGFTERELADIRRATKDRKATFCDCVYNALSGGVAGETIKNKVSAFYAYFNKMRLFSEFAGAPQTLRRIVSDSGFDLKLLSLSGGKVKLKRVNLIINGSEKSGEKSTIREFLDYVNVNSSSLSAAAETNENAVKIMSIHASKGLEFPVVILYGTGNGFNYTDAYGNVVLSRKYGVGIKTFNPDEMTVRDNIVRKFISYKVARGLEREEVRKLYVALTRAKYELHVLTGRGIYEKLGNVAVKNNAQYAFFADCDLKVRHIGSLMCGGDSEGVAVAGNIVDESLVGAIRENLTYSYPFAANETLPVKSSVSQINDVEDEYYEVIDFSEEERLCGTAAETGTAYHKFLELADFYAPAEKTFGDLVAANKFGQARAELIDVKKLQSILDMPVFKEIKGGKFYKELKFCALLSGEALGYGGASDEVLVQGVADLISVKNGKATLIDYKYSAIKNDGDIIKKYKKQLMLYKYAIENVLKIEVEKIYIINVLQLKQICVKI